MRGMAWMVLRVRDKNQNTLSCTGMRLDEPRLQQILDGLPRLPKFPCLPDSAFDAGRVVMAGLSGILGTKDGSNRLGGLGVVQGRPKRF